MFTNILMFYLLCFGCSGRALESPTTMRGETDPKLCVTMDVADVKVNHRNFLCERNGRSHG